MPNNCPLCSSLCSSHCGGWAGAWGIIFRRHHQKVPVCHSPWCRSVLPKSQRLHVPPQFWIHNGKLRIAFQNTQKVIGHSHMARYKLHISTWPVLMTCEDHNYLCKSRNERRNDQSAQKSKQSFMPIFFYTFLLVASFYSIVKLIWMM